MNRPFAIVLFLVIVGSCRVQSGECDHWQTLHPEWIFCDDFEDTGALVKPGRYFDYDSSGGDFVKVNGVGLNGSHGMRATFQQGAVSAGSLKLAFGRNPNASMNKQQISPAPDFREIYYRMYLKMQAGWKGNDPAKLSRATCFVSASDWRQAMIAHLWSDDSAHLLIDPASCVNSNGAVVCTTYNDFDHLSWLGNKSGTTPIFATDHANRWYCIEAHVKLNDPGQSNGIQEFWIDSNLEARRTGLNFVGTFSQYAINAIFFENYWNSGSVQLQERYFDNIVVSTQPIGFAPASVGASQPRLHTGSDAAVRTATHAGGVITFVSSERISGVALYSAAGKSLGKYTVDNRSMFTIGNRGSIQSFVFYTLDFTDKKRPSCTGLINGK